MDILNDENLKYYILIFVVICLIIYGIFSYYYKQPISFSRGNYRNYKIENPTKECVGSYTEYSSCDKLCNGTQTRTFIPMTPSDTCVSKTEDKSCNYCGDINTMNDVNTYYKTDKRSFNGDVRGNIINNKSVQECGKMCNDNESCSGFSYYNSKLMMPESYWDKNGTCQTYTVEDYKTNKLNKDGQPSWPNLISGIKIRLIQ